MFSFFHFLVIAPTVDLFSPGNFSVALSSLVKVYNFVFSVFGQLFGLGHVSSWILNDCMVWTVVFMQLTTSNRCISKQSMI